MISHDKRFVFVHISKTGGNSVQNVLAKYSAHPARPQRSPAGRTEGFEVLYKNENIKHWSLRQYAEQWDIRNYHKFTVVRNPWDRMLSLYAFRHGVEGKLDPEGLAGMLDNEDQAVETYRDKLSLSGTLQIDSVIRFEALQEGFDVVCRDLGIRAKRLPHRNRSSHGHYRDYYDSVTEEMVRRKYAEDIETFGYDF